MTAFFESFINEFCAKRESKACGPGFSEIIHKMLYYDQYSRKFLSAKVSINNILLDRGSTLINDIL